MEVRAFFGRIVWVVLTSMTSQSILPEVRGSIPHWSRTQQPGSSASYAMYFQVLSSAILFYFIQLRIQFGIFFFEIPVSFLELSIFFFEVIHDASDSGDLI